MKQQKITSGSLKINKSRNIPCLEDYIATHPEIPKCILDVFVHAQVPFDEIKGIELSRKRSGLNQNYSSMIETSQALPFDFINGEINMFQLESENDSNVNINKKVKSAKKIFEKGCIKGFENFIRDKIDNPLDKINSRNSKIKKIIEFISGTLSSNKPTNDVDLESEEIIDFYTDGLNAGYHYAAWYIIFQNFQLFKSFFTKQITIKDGVIKTDFQEPSKEAEHSEEWKYLIKEECLPLVQKAEKMAAEKIKKWQQLGDADLIECAAFFQLFFDKNYLVEKSTCRISVNKYCYSKYGIEINNQLDSTRKKYRETHKKRLNQYFQ